jgi:hypothetical protein
VVQIVTHLDPEISLVAAVAERVGVDDSAVDGFDVNFVSHERQSSIEPAAAVPDDRARLPI